ncbi:MAG: hypothetical protein ACRYFX_18960 [Janthinobacterium lividum]
MYLDDELDPSAFFAPPADLTVQVAADCRTATAVLARDTTGIAGYAIAVTAPSGAVLNLIPQHGTNPVTTSLSFATVQDGLYMLQPSDTAGVEYLAIPVLVLCRLRKCQRRLNKQAATNGPAKRGKAPSGPLEELNAVLAMLDSIYSQGDLVSADALVARATELCTDCGCGDC